MEARATELSCDVPTNFALLPSNFPDAPSKDALLYKSSTLTLRKVLRAAHLEETPLSSPEDSITVDVRKSFDWLGPVIAFVAQYVASNPQL